MKFRAIKIKTSLGMINGRLHTTTEKLNELENRLVIIIGNKWHKYKEQVELVPFIKIEIMERPETDASFHFSGIE